MKGFGNFNYKMNSLNALYNQAAQTGNYQFTGMLAQAAQNMQRDEIKREKELIKQEYDMTL